MRLVWLLCFAKFGESLYENYMNEDGSFSLTAMEENFQDGFAVNNGESIGGYQDRFQV